MKQTIIDEAKKVIVGDNAAEITIVYAKKTDTPNDDDYAFTAASTSGAGSVSGTLQITLGEENETVAFAFVIPKQEEEQPTTPTVSSIEITCTKDSSPLSAPIEASAGDTLTFAATVKGTDNSTITGDDAKVTWTVTGNSDNTTAINQDSGVLTIGGSEAADSDVELTITATSVKNSSVTQTAKVTVKAATTEGDA